MTESAAVPALTSANFALQEIGRLDMGARTHEQILMEQFNAVLADVKLWADLYEKTRKPGYKIAAAQNWGVLCGLAMAAKQFGIFSLQETLDGLNPLGNDSA